MSAVVGQDWRPKTFRELFIQWQSVQLDRWDHTAHVKGALSFSKVNFEDLHPYRASTNSGQAVVKPVSLFRDSLENDDFMEQMLRRDESE